jgi:hypothetical protein
MISTKAQRSSPRGQATVLILYHIRKHNNFQLNWRKVWPVEIPQFLAWNLNDHPGSELGALEVEFGPLPMGKPD